jgi:predicted ATPase
MVGGVPAHLERALHLYRYGRVFMVPPWPEIFRNDVERTHSFEDALVHYSSQLQTYERHGYAPTFIPKLPVAERADFVLREIGKLR